MIKHLFKLIWNKKRANALIMIEILFSFLVLFAVVTMIIFNLQLYKQPLGFSYTDVWNIDIDTKLTFDSSYNAVKKQTVQQVLLALHGMPEIEGMCAWAIPPYSNYQSTWGDETDGKFLRISIHDGSVDAKKVLGLQLVEGRWFEESDKALSWTPLVINQRLSRERFGNASAIGKNPFPLSKDATAEERSQRVIGVISDFRKGGEFSAPENVSIQYLDIESTTQAVSSNLLIKVRPGTTVAFEEKLVHSLESIAKGWTFDVRSLEEMRKADFKPRFTFMLTVGLITGFLLLMVALGLVGVLWQNVSQRTQEIGLRRALGSSERQVYKQILGELLVLTTIGLLIGTVIIIQFPLLDLIVIVPANVYAFGFLISAGLMYLLTAVCGFYPSTMAVDIQPAEALHYE